MARTVYLGPAHLATSYFESFGFEMRKHMNPADFLIDVVSGKIVSEPSRRVNARNLQGQSVMLTDDLGCSSILLTLSVHSGIFTYTPHRGYSQHFIPPTVHADTHS